ncbi:MAG: vitamin K epoxide reductase family protein [Chthonomonadaceae bacterium]|nr:vitamin K epoxide reductase family protein [Chthonomonadaceae bacterium]
MDRSGARAERQRGLMNRKLTNILTLIFACLGGLDALILTVRHFLPSLPLGCSAGPSGCEGVLKGAYSHFGPIPTAALGLGMYGILIFLCVKRAGELSLVEARNRQAATDYAERAENEAGPLSTSPVLIDRSRLRNLDALVFGLSLTGTLFSVWLQYTSLFVLLSFCPYCFFSACMISLVALLAARDFIMADRSLNGEQKLIVAVVGGVIALMCLLYVPTVVMQFLRTQKGVTVFTPYTPRETLAPANLRIKGKADAPVLLVEFADYQCTHCKEATDTVNLFMRNHPEKVKLAFRNFPLPMHKWATEASKACEAAGLQGKFWEYHDLIFERQEMLTKPDFNPETFGELAKSLNLDTVKFRTDCESPSISEVVSKDLEVGKANQVDTTPTFFIITPKRIWRAVGRTELLSVLDDPKHDVWKAAGMVPSDPNDK